MRVTDEVAMEGLGVAPLEPVVELLADRAGELVHELAHVDEVERPDALLGDSRGLVEEAEVGLDLLRRARPLHLDGDDVAVREHRAVDLADRGRGHRLAVELEEETLDRLAELLADDALDLLVGERAHVVLKPAQLGDDVRRQHVGPHREELAELDEGRAELVEELAQVLPALRRCAVGDPRAVPATREEVGQLVALEEVAEAVPDGDLGDLSQPAEVTSLGWCLSHDPKCSTPVPEALVTRDFLRHVERQRSLHQASVEARRAIKCRSTWSRPPLHGRLVRRVLARCRPERGFARTYRASCFEMLIRLDERTR